MNKKVKMLLLGVGVILLLVAVLVVLKLTEPKTDDDTASSSSVAQVETIKLIEKTADDCESVTIKNELGEYTIDKLGEKKWGNKNLEKYPQMDDNYATTVSNLSTLNAALKVVDKAENLSEYGLDKPTATAVIKYSDAEYNIKIGADTPDGAQAYAMIDEDETVYTVSSSVASTLRNGELVYIARNLIASYDTQDAAAVPNVEKVTIKRKDMEAPIVLEKALALTEEEKELSAYSSGFKMKSPINADVDSNADQELILSMFGLVATDVVAIEASTHMDEYGFNDPTVVVELAYDSRNVKLVVGNPVEGKEGEYYLLYNDNDVVYTVAADSLAAINYDPNKMISRLVVLPYIDSIGVINLNVNDKDYKFETTGVDDDLKVTVNGTEVKTDLYKKFYQLLLSVSVEKINYKQPQGEPVMKIEYVYRENNANKTNEVVEIFEDENRRMVIALNGEANFEGRIAYLNKVETEINNLLAGNPVDTDW